MSVAFRARDAVDWTGGRLLQGRPDARLEGASIDSRTLVAGELFTAIVGESHDGHAFLSRAVAAGAAGLIVARGRALPAELKPDLPVIGVEDTTRALGALAAGHRGGFEGPVVAITGSNGKTTTKEMCAAILGIGAPCLKNPGNLNNHWGLPLSLLQRSETDRSVVVELGMNHRGEIAELAAIARPSVGVITNVGVAHIEHLGSQEEIALEKGDLVAGLPADGTAVLNADDPRVAAQAQRTGARVLRFGRGAGAEVRAEDVRRLERGAFAFSLAAPQGRVAVEVAGLGETTLANALAAAAGALAAGAAIRHVAEGLAGYRPVSGRLEPFELSGGGLLIDDSYNANPQSMQVALELLAERGSASGGRTLAVLGDMGELGDTAAPAHAEVGALAARLGIDSLVALGEHASRLTRAAVDAGLAPDSVAVASDHDDAVARVRSRLGGGDCVLVKGSRAMHMERVVRALREEES
jgi:UDP-N-acetylmuramoyl-tripeptide--D-alanyl-D-alanine ligase